jgi:hypothetical protein
MRWLLALASLAGVIAPAAAAVPPPIELTQDSATIAASPALSGARPAALSLMLHYEMLCAQPGRGPVTVAFPSALRVPATIPTSAVLVNGKAAPAVRVTGHMVTVGLPPIDKVICQSFVPGTLRIGFTRLARFGNPRHPGVYAVRARVGSHSFVARLLIRP